MWWQRTSRLQPESSDCGNGGFRACLFRRAPTVRRDELVASEDHDRRLGAVSVPTSRIASSAWAMFSLLATTAIPHTGRSSTSSVHMPGGLQRAAPRFGDHAHDVDLRHGSPAEVPGEVLHGDHHEALGFP